MKIKKWKVIIEITDAPEFESGEKFATKEEILNSMKTLDLFAGLAINSIETEEL